MNVYQKNLVKNVDELKKQMIRVATYMGENPELGMEEFKAQKVLTRFLWRHGFRIKKGVGGLKTAFVATRQLGPGPNIGFLAEYDALPGIGHACGHNLIGTASSAAAVAVSQALKKDFTGTVTVVGCPAEESGGGGKVILAKKGIFKPLSVAMMVHPDSRTEPIKKMLSMIEVDIEFFGKTSHAAAAPEKGINALDAAVATYTELVQYRKGLKRDARLHGIVTSGGEKPSIIPDHAALKYYVRALDMKYTKKMVEAVKKIANKHARKVGARTKMVVNPITYEPFHPNRALARVFKKQLKLLKIKDEQGSETKGIGSSDVGNVAHIVPTIHPQLKICDGLAPHTPQFAKAALRPRGFQGMVYAAKAMALTSYELFSNPKHLKRIREEFKRRKQ